QGSNSKQQQEISLRHLPKLQQTSKQEIPFSQIRPHPSSPVAAASLRVHRRSWPRQVLRRRRRCHHSPPRQAAAVIRNRSGTTGPRILSTPLHSSLCAPLHPCRPDGVGAGCLVLHHQQRLRINEGRRTVREGLR
uniref:Uncharacterized protein n=1 Tax=Leersia perrieri TaxID=77586 RepID=A0A0D9W4K7_9ORYZ